MQTESSEKPKVVLATVPIDRRLHRVLKQRAFDEDKPIREVAEALLGAALGWTPEDGTATPAEA